MQSSNTTEQQESGIESTNFTTLEDIKNEYNIEFFYKEPFTILDEIILGIFNRTLSFNQLDQNNPCVLMNYARVIKDENPEQAQSLLKKSIGMGNPIALSVLSYQIFQKLNQSLSNLNEFITFVETLPQEIVGFGVFNNIGSFFINYGISGNDKSLIHKALFYLKRSWQIIPTSDSKELQEKFKTMLMKNIIHALYNLNFDDAIEKLHSMSDIEFRFTEIIFYALREDRHAFVLFDRISGDINIEKFMQIILMILANVSMNIQNNEPNIQLLKRFSKYTSNIDQELNPDDNNISMCRRTLNDIFFP